MLLVHCSIIPFEFLDLDSVEQFKALLKLKHCGSDTSTKPPIADHSIETWQKLITEPLPNVSDDKRSTPVDQDLMAYSWDDSQSCDLYFEGTICCVVKRMKQEFSGRSADALRAVQEYRSKTHGEILNDPRTCLPIELVQFLAGSKYHTVVNDQPSYVFSFCAIYAPSENDKQGLDTMCRVLAEPSTAGIRNDETEISDRTGLLIDTTTLTSLRDEDMAWHTTAYITWSTISAYSTGSLTEFWESVMLYVMLECKLQGVWNKCHILGRHIDVVINEEIVQQIPEASLLDVVRAYDEILGVLSPTISSRAHRLFSAMKRTSHLESGLSRLLRKIELIRDYIESQSLLRQRRSARTIELMLFLVAAFSVVPLVAHLPLVESTSEEIICTIGLILLFACLGYLIIFRRDSNQ